MKSHQIWELCVLERVRHHLHLFWMPGNRRQVRRVCVYVWLHVWLHMQRLKRIVVIWQNQCLGIARKGGDTRSQNNGLVPCKMHTRTGLSVQQRRQMWTFIIQLCFDNALDMSSKKNEACTWHISTVRSTYAVNILLIVTLLIPNMVRTNTSVFAHLSLNRMILASALTKR